MMKKLFRISVILVLSVFIVYNIFWYIYIYSAYDKYTNNMVEFRKNISYVLNDGEFLYNVKYPSYLQMSGNLCVATSDGNYALIIWPSLQGDNRYGVQLLDSYGQIQSYMIDKNEFYLGNYLNTHIETTRDIITELFELADEHWE